MRFNLKLTGTLPESADVTGRLAAEYRALRASVLRLWRESLPHVDLNDINDITRFNESLDQSLARGVGSYSKRIDDSRQMFLAILSHDLIEGTWTRAGLATCSSTTRARS